MDQLIFPERRRNSDGVSISSSVYDENNYTDVSVSSESQDGSIANNAGDDAPQTESNEDTNINHMDFHSYYSSEAESSSAPSSDSQNSERGIRRAPVDFRYSVAARAKAVTPESKTKRALPNTESFYAIKTPEIQEEEYPNNLNSFRMEEVVKMPEPIEEAKKVGFKDLFRFATIQDILLLAFSFLCAICGGALIPFMPIIFSQFANSFLQVGTNVKPVLSVLVHYTFYWIYLAAAEFVAIFLATFGLTRIGERMTRRIREEYLSALLRQDIEYFGKVGVGECTTRLTEDINNIQKGISEKIARTIHALSTFTCALVIAFICYWKLAAELLWSVGIGLIVMSIGIYLSSSLNARISDANGTATSIAEEAISSIRNVKALNAESRLSSRYSKVIAEASRWATRQKVQLGVSLGITITVNYLNIALILWQGSRAIARGDASFTDVFIIELVITQALYALIGIANHVETFTKALGAAQKVFQTIDRPSDFDATSDKGTIVDPLRGTVKLDNVTFRYPSRPDVTILSHVDLTFPAGQITALVGASGSGKSSIIDLILRFYDPQGGHVLLDSVDVHSLNLRWLRRQIGVVNQDPVLFDLPIHENIRHGLIGTEYEKESAEVQLNRAIAAAIAANAHDFISKLPDTYLYQVGDRGSRLSGGQRQRIAIARALIANPQILLLDEATSAIDSESENKIVAYLEAEKSTRTTIVIAHRLSTIKAADNIIVLEKGKVVEQGSHDLLMFQKGAYWKLVKAGQPVDVVEEPVAAHDKHNIRASSVYSAYPPSVPTIKRPLIKSPTPSIPAPKPVHAAIHQGSAANPTGDIELDVLTSEGKKRISRVASQFQYQYHSKPEKASFWALVRFAVRFNNSEIWLNCLGILCCLFGGAEEAVNAILFGMSTISLSLPQGQYVEMLSQVVMWAWIYLGFAFFQLFFFGGQGITLGISSERMLRRVKESAFRSALHQDVAFYDASKSSSSTMVSLLSSETNNMCGLSGFALGNLMIVGSTLCTAVFIGIGFGWKLALVCTATVPIVLGCGFLSVAFLGQHSAATSAEVLAAANAATEALSEIRTVLILTREAQVLRQYYRALSKLERKSFWTAVKVSLIYAVCQSVVYLCMALGFWFGGTLIAKGEYSPLQFFIAFTSVIFGARSAGYFFSFADDMAKAVKGTRLIKELVERRVHLNSSSDEGIPIKKKMMGAIQFISVTFNYPGQNRNVLSNLSFSVMPHQRVALVGPSGCGKSSIISLLERFYDPVSGAILIDDEHINRLCLGDYRGQMALVSQDVTLYEGTIRDNITLGISETRPEWVDKKVAAAISCANLTDFIASLPEGLSTKIGTKGCMLSGGQKQRISIARAILRDPAILLLDEATSALDAESERVVQQALDAASEGRTTITVAHRLNTIRNADCIYFLEGGNFVESGKHEDLMKLNGRYAEFVRLQEMEDGAKPVILS